MFLNANYENDERRYYNIYCLFWNLYINDIIILIVDIKIHISLNRKKNIAIRMWI